MNDIDRQLSILLQSEIPIIASPFTALGEKLGLDGAEVLLRTHHLKSGKKFDEITGIFDGKNFGYQTALAAAHCPEEKIDFCATILEDYPAVFNLVKRNHFFNLWFSLALPQGEILEQHLNLLCEMLIIEPILFLPALRLFPVSEEKPLKKISALTPLEMEVVRALQEDFPLTDEPYRKMAKDAGISEDLFLETAQSLARRGHLKKIVAITNSREQKEGVHILWQIPEERLPQAARQLVDFPEVHLCTRRIAYPELPYNLYVEVKTSTLTQAEEIAGRIEKQIGRWPHLSLCNLKEYKKGRARYFPKNLDKWKNKASDFYLPVQTDSLRGAFS